MDATGFSSALLHSRGPGELSFLSLQSPLCSPSIFADLQSNSIEQAPSTEHHIQSHPLLSLALIMILHIRTFFQCIPVTSLPHVLQMKRPRLFHISMRDSNQIQTRHFSNCVIGVLVSPKHHQAIDFTLQGDATRSRPAVLTTAHTKHHAVLS